MIRFSPLALATVALAAGCGGGLQPEPVCAGGLVGICGTVRFSGPIPDSTDNVFMAAYATFPQTCTDLINNRQPFLPPTVPYTDSVAPYGMELPTGSYAWVLAVWKKEGQLTLSPADTALLRVAGYFRDPADSTQPGRVVVAPGGAAADVDFRARFDSLRPATDFVTC